MNDPLGITRTPDRPRSRFCMVPRPRSATGPARRCVPSMRGEWTKISNAGRGSVSEDHELVVGNFAASAAAGALAM